MSPFKRKIEGKWNTWFRFSQFSSNFAFKNEV